MDDIFFKRLLDTFKTEARQHLQQMSNCLARYESSDKAELRAELIETIYRAAHSLKGAARAVNMFDIENICKNLEYLFAGIKKGDIEASPVLFDAIHEALDLVSEFLLAGDDASREECLNDIRALTPKLGLLNLNSSTDENRTDDVSFKAYFSSATGGDAQAPVKENTLSEQDKSQTAPDFVRVDSSKLESLFLKSEQFLSVKLTSEETASELRNIQSAVEGWKREWKKFESSIKKEKNTGRQGIHNTRDCNNFSAFNEWNNQFIASLSDKLKKLTRSSYQNNRIFGTMVNELVENVKEVMMLPFSNLLDLFPKLVRDLARDLGKEADLRITGSDIHIDRRILEEIKDPLIHIIRNCIDHGIESPEERKAHAKDARGKIFIDIQKLEGNKIEISISDDGRSIDPEKVKAAAVSKGFLTAGSADNMTEQELINLVFLSGITTSRAITDISGHGLGLAIVKERVEKLNGSIRIDSGRNSGTAFIISIPHVMATFRGVVINSSGQYFIVPANSVEQAIRFSRSSVKTAGNKDVLSINGQPVSLVQLSDILGLRPDPDTESRKFSEAVILRSNDKRIAFEVSRILSEQEILIKPFNRQLVRVRNISAVTVLGDGRVVPVLNTPDLFKTAEARSGVSEQRQTSSGTVPSEKNILVVDDSITSRMLIKDILETAGYCVYISVDGVDALTTLKMQKIDLVVSDVEMPRMTGFDLTRNIRNTPALSAIPVILVTGLARREDREEGIDAGANAYIVKSSFEQNNLLETVERLL